MEDSREKGKALIDAIKEGNLEKVKHMIKNENVDVNWVDTIHNKNTPLHIAAYKNNVPIIDFLIKNSSKTQAACIHGMPQSFFMFLL